VHAPTNIYGLTELRGLPVPHRFDFFALTRVGRFRAHAVAAASGPRAAGSATTTIDREFTGLPVGVGLHDRHFTRSFPSARIRFLDSLDEPMRASSAAEAGLDLVDDQGMLDGWWVFWMILAEKRGLLRRKNVRRRAAPRSRKIRGRAPNVIGVIVGR